MTLKTLVVTSLFTLVIANGGEGIYQLAADGDQGQFGGTAGSISTGEDSVTVEGWYRDSFGAPGVSGTGSGRWGSSGSGVDVAWGGGTGGGGPAVVTASDVGCSAQIGLGVWSRDDCPLIGAVRADADPSLDPAGAGFVAPSTWDILQQGLATARIPGAGVVVQPLGDSYVGVATLVHASTTVQNLRVVVLGVEVPIHLEAESFSFDFGDGSAPLVTSDPGAAYPVRTNQHTYERAQASVSVGLVTTWGASVVNPFTGESLRVDGVVSTRERSRSFAVVRAHTVVTDLAEEKAGH